MIIWLASYPKSGNTWVRLFLNSLVFTSDAFVNINDIRLEQFPTRKYFKDITNNVDDLTEFIQNCNYAQSKLNLDNNKLVKNSIIVVQMHLCMRTSICPTNDIYLKYITPINPHQTDPKLANKMPLLKSLLDVIIN